MMRFTRSCWILPFAVGVYRVLLLAYPAEHRSEYGPLMVQLFRDRCRDLCQAKGTWALIRFWGRVLQDTMVTSFFEQIDRLKERSRQMTKRQRSLVGACTVGPLVLWGGLFAINPKFMGRLFVEPLGWAILAATVLLLCLSYVLQRWAFHSAAVESSSLVMGKLTLSGLIFLGTFVFLVLPAVLLIFMGPAIVTVATGLGR